MSIAGKLATIAENMTKIYSKGKEQGKTDAYNEFWDEIQQGGERKDYDYAFAGSGWTPDRFKPKHVIVPTRALGMFQKASKLNISIIDYVDLTECTALANAFNESAINTMGIINATKTGTKNLNYVFLNAKNLYAIGGIDVDESTTYVQAFQNCDNLTEISFTGTIAAEINFQWSPKLSKDSLWRIRNALTDDVSKERTVTFSKVAVNTAFGVDVDDENNIDVASEYWSWCAKGNWRFVYV